MDDDQRCPGPMRWWPVPPSQAEKDAGARAHALIECESCDYLIVSPTPHDPKHQLTVMMRGRGIDQEGRAG